MKTLELAAKYGYYTLDSIPEHIKNDDYFRSNKEWNDPKFYEKRIPEGLMSLKNVQCGVFVKIKEEFNNDGTHSLYFVDYPNRILVFSDKTEIPLMLCENKGKYYLFPICEEINKIQRNTNYEQRKEFLQEVKEPNRIGVFTEKKVEAWVDYCINYLDACKKASAFVEGKKAENLAYIEHVISSVECRGIQRYHDYTVIETNYFTIEFELQDNGFYLRKKVTFKGGIETIIDKKL